VFIDTVNNSHGKSNMIHHCDTALVASLWHDLN